MIEFTPERAPQSVNAYGVPLRQIDEGPLADGGAVANRLTTRGGGEHLAAEERLDMWRS